MKDISIVVVDDDPEFSSSVKMFFAGEGGYRVLSVASSGREGVAAILEHSPDVVLLDMILPGTDGFEVMSEAKRGGSTAKFIVLSGIAGDEYASRAIKNGASHYMLKPISFLSLKNRIDEIVGVAATTLPVRTVPSKMLDERITNIFIAVVLEPQGIKLECTPQAIAYLAEEGYDPDYGARPVKRAIQQFVLNDLSKKLLADEVDRSKPIIIDEFGDGLVFRN